MSVYPSDAPLPQFQVSNVLGTIPLGTSLVGLQFEGYITNYGQISDYCNNHGIIMADLTFHTAELHQVIFKDLGSRIYHRYNTGDIPISTDYGKWVRLEFAKITFAFEEFTFSSPLYFCDVYVPSNLVEGVWTDLQFKQTSNQGSSGSGLAIVAVPLILLFIGFLFIGLSGRGRKRGRR